MILILQRIHVRHQQFASLNLVSRFSCSNFPTTPLFFLKRRAFFKSQPQECYFSPLNNSLVKSQNCPHRGQMCLPRGAHDPAALSCLAACGFSLCRNPPAGGLLLRLPFPQCSRTLAQRPVFWCPVGTCSAASRKRHKLPTRARRAGIGVLSVRSTCVLNKIGIFPPCCVLGKLLHLPVIVLLKRRLNRSDGKSQIAVARFSILCRNHRRLCDEQAAFFE